jgi:tRNA pseudouridine38-40 synthase
MRDAASSTSAIAVPADATRWRLDLAYDGTRFSGWAAQGGQRTVQGELETWLTRVLRQDAPIRLIAAGRTDAGVHARGQVAHLDLEASTAVEPVALTRRLNHVLDDDIAVRRVSVAPPGFDARFAAVWRRYVYRLADGDVRPDPLLRYQVTAVRPPLDVDLLNASATTLLGLRDFAPFCRRRDGATTIRTLLALRAERVASGPLAGLVECTVQADAFCHSMVRSLVGALAAVASGRRDLDWLRSVASGTTRDSTVPVLGPGGLTLEEVGYPADHELARRTRQARAVRELA